MSRLRDEDIFQRRLAERHRGDLLRKRFDKFSQQFVSVSTLDSQRLAEQLGFDPKPLRDPLR